MSDKKYGGFNPYDESRENFDYSLSDDESYPDKAKQYEKDETRVFGRPGEAFEEQPGEPENISSFSEEYRRKRAEDFGDGYDDYSEDDGESEDCYDGEYEDDYREGGNYRVSGNNSRGSYSRSSSGGGRSRGGRNVKRRKKKDGKKIAIIIISIIAAIAIAALVIMAISNSSNKNENEEPSSSSESVSESVSESSTAATYYANDETTAPTTAATTAPTAESTTGEIQVGVSVNLGAKTVKDSAGNDTDVVEAFGTSYLNYGGGVKLSPDGSFDIYMGVSDWNGTYNYENGQIRMKFSDGSTQTCDPTVSGGKISGMDLTLDGYRVHFG